MEHYITPPFTKEKASQLNAGDTVYISGEIYTSRDAAHLRLVELLKNNQTLPYNVKDTIVYYVGPTPEKPGKVLGSAGPTTSYRMDSYSPLLLKEGQLGMIGKGGRSEDVIHAMQQYGGVYFAAIGGAGALLSHCIIYSEVVAYDDLGAEAIRKLVVENFPVTVAIDSMGNNLYHDGPSAYLRSIEKV